MAELFNNLGVETADVIITGEIGAESNSANVKRVLQFLDEHPGFFGSTVVVDCNGTALAGKCYGGRSSDTTSTYTNR